MTASVVLLSSLLQGVEIVEKPTNQSATQQKLREHRLAVMARLHHDMLEGIYPWEDGRPRPLDPETHQYGIERKELLARAGYGNYRGGADYFKPETEYGRLYLRYFIAEEKRRNAEQVRRASFEQLPEKERMAALATQELYRRVEHRPEEFKPAELTKLRADMIAEAAAEGVSTSSRPGLEARLSTVLAHLPRPERLALLHYIEDALREEVSDETDGTEEP